MLENKINLYIAPLNPHIEKISIEFDGRFNNVDLRDKRCEFYNSWKNNSHHWTSECAVEFGKMIAANENIELCRYDKKYIRTFDHQDMCVFYPHTDKKYETFNISTSEMSRGGAEILSFDIKRNKKFYWGWKITGYHQVFYGSHMISRTVNRGVSNGRRVMVIADSMFIPLARIFAGSCRELVVIDGRFFKGGVSFNRDEFDNIFILCFQRNYENVISYYDKYVV